jgi:uncharacterized membrane-anchored protein
MTQTAPTRWRYHPDRDRLIAEAHARPYAPLGLPMMATRIATLSSADDMAADRQQMVDLCRKLGSPEPGPDARWAVLDAGGWQMRWERHTEFSTWTFFRTPTQSEVFDQSALDLVPRDWLDKLPGHVLVATRLDLRPRTQNDRPLDHFAADAVGAHLIGNAASVYSDFRTDAGGMTRFLLLAEPNDPALAGRLVLSLLELETYRLMALLAFPLAGEAGAIVARIEGETGQLAAQLASESDPANDKRLLSRLAELAGEAEALSALTNFRFGAAEAYHEIVLDRLNTFREERIDGLQTLTEFMERRLGPAMRTCASVARRERAAIERIARTGQMLNTRVEVASEANSLALLESMNRRAGDQLRLQRTVEGLSVAAIAYYAVGLISFVFKALEKGINNFDPALATGIAAPFVFGLVWLMLRRLKAKLGGQD